MTNKEKEEITILRCSGYSYKEIASLVGVTKSAVSNYCLRQQITSPGYKTKEYRVCPNCKQLFLPSGRQKNNQQFCSSNCRKDYWRKEQKSSQNTAEEANSFQEIKKELEYPLLGKRTDDNIALLCSYIEPTTKEER